ncbi:MAG TPA: rRNA maturation RNase YbeY [Longimicrobiaceae bacterium]|nr:rRNA maturation RNase YbeY [Longimicrobiaceae bacterium]
MAEPPARGVEVEVGLGEGVASPVDAAAVERAVRATLLAEGHAAGEVSVALLADPAMVELNCEYLGHDRPTDVISFALHGDGEPPLGDVYLGVEQALRQAEELGVDPGEELLRLTVHGTLHVLGWDHPEGEERLGSDMFRRQEEILRGLLGSGELRG